MRWYLKQLLPLTYRSHYVADDRRHHFVVWRMWLGSRFDIEDVETSSRNPA